MLQIFSLGEKKEKFLIENRLEARVFFNWKKIFLCVFPNFFSSFFASFAGSQIMAECRSNSLVSIDVSEREDNHVRQKMKTCRDKWASRSQDQSRAQGCQIFLGPNIPKREKNFDHTPYQTAIHYTKRP
jgi:hypothetical protein